MRILSPLTKVEEVKPLIRAGADELYCGISSPNWRKHCLRASSNLYDIVNSNFGDYNKLQTAIESAHSYDVPVFLTLNALEYSQKERDVLLRKLKRQLISAWTHLLLRMCICFLF